MSIEEKKKPLEFTYMPTEMVTGDTHEFAINVVYDEDLITGRNRLGMLFPINITMGNNTINCPVEFFQEVVVFLIQKGVIKPGVLNRIARSQGITLPTINDGALSSTTDGIPLPNIEKKEQKDAPFTRCADPLASFDITSIASEVTKDEITTGTPVGPVITADGSPSPKINRPVIRTRVTGDDPQSAEKEAAAIRSASGKGAKKAIKRKA